MNICKNCVHCNFRPDVSDLSTCGHQKLLTVDPVSGETIPRYCSVLRIPMGPCGVQGNFFQARSPE